MQLPMVTIAQASGSVAVVVFRYLCPSEIVGGNLLFTVHLAPILPSMAFAIPSMSAKGLWVVLYDLFRNCGW